MLPFSVGDRVSWRGVNRIETGEIRSITEKGIVIQLDNGKVIIADAEGLTKI